jgi:hypothetical protein
VIWASNKEFKKDASIRSVSPYFSDVVAEISKTLNYKYFREAATSINSITNNSASGKMPFGYPDELDDRAKYKPFEWSLSPSKYSVDPECVVSGKMNMSYGKSTIHGGVAFDDVHIELKNKQRILLGSAVGDLGMFVVISAEQPDHEQARVVSLSPTQPASR